MADDSDSLRVHIAAQRKRGVAVCRDIREVSEGLDLQFVARGDEQLARLHAGMIERARRSDAQSNKAALHKLVGKVASLRLRIEARRGFRVVKDGEHRGERTTAIGHEQVAVALT